MNQLFAVAAVAADDVWAVGEQARALPLHKKKWPYAWRYLVQPLVEHWNGTKWTMGPSPPGSVKLPFAAKGAVAYPAVPGNELGLNGVSAAASGDVLALETPPGESGPAFESIWQLNGEGWSPLTGYQPTPADSFHLTSAIVTAHDDAWAMGYDLGETRTGCHSLGR